MYMLQYVAACCRVLQCVEVCCIVSTAACWFLDTVASHTQRKQYIKCERVSIFDLFEGVTARDRIRSARETFCM